MVLLAQLDSYDGDEDNDREVLEPRTPSTLGLSPSVSSLSFSSRLVLSTCWDCKEGK